MIYWLIDWLVFNTNFSGISAILWWVHDIYYVYKFIAYLHLQDTSKLQCVEDFLYQNKNHTFNWLNTLHMTFTIPRYRLECWYRPAQKPCIDWYYWSIHGYLFAYVLINYNVTYNLILFLIISWTPFKQLL